MGYVKPEIVDDAYCDICGREEVMPCWAIFGNSRTGSLCFSCISNLFFDFQIGQATAERRSRKPHRRNSL